MSTSPPGASPFMRPKRSGLADIVGQILGAIGDVEFSAQDPYWRQKQRRQQLEEEQQRAQLDNTRIAGGTARAGLYGKLADMAAMGMQGFAEGAPPQEQIKIPSTPPEGGDTGLGGYAVNLPTPGTAPPDFLPDEMAHGVGLDLPPSLKAAILQAAKGKAVETKRQIETLKAQEAAARQASSQTFRTGERVAHESFLSDQQRKYIEARRRDLLTREGGVNSRFRQGQAATESRFQRGQQAGTLRQIDRADAQAYRNFDRETYSLDPNGPEYRFAQSKLYDRLSENAASLGDPFAEDQAPTAAAAPPSRPSGRGGAAAAPGRKHGPAVEKRSTPNGGTEYRDAQGVVWRE